MTTPRRATSLAAQCRASVGSEAGRLLAVLPGGDKAPRRHDDDAATGVPADADPAATCAILDWARWGAMDLTGWPDDRPAAPATPVAARIRGALLALAAATGRWGAAVEVDPSWLLQSRAAMSGFGRGGRVSAKGSCRLLPGRDGEWVAVNLSRAPDAEVVAGLAGGATDDPRPALALGLAATGGAEFTETLQSLEVPAALLGSCADGSALGVEAIGAPLAVPPREPLVVDLSAMWAGLLCAHLLGRAGARIVKVEDRGRPDGAWSGPARFFDDLHAGHEQRWLDFRDPTDRLCLRELVESADVVIESSRPRALAQLGIDADRFVRSRPGRTWISITGYGRHSEWSNRVAFGDDAAVAGGLVARDSHGDPVFCADAIADPLTGVYAALAGAASISVGGGHLIDTAMAGVSADVSRPAPGLAFAHRLEHGGAGWRVRHDPAAPDERPGPWAGVARKSGC